MFGDSVESGESARLQFKAIKFHTIRSSDEFTNCERHRTNLQHFVGHGIIIQHPRVSHDPSHDVSHDLIV